MNNNRRVQTEEDPFSGDNPYRPQDNGGVNIGEATTLQETIGKVPQEEVMVAHLTVMSGWIAKTIGKKPSEGQIFVGLNTRSELEYEEVATSALDDETWRNAWDKDMIRYKEGSSIVKYITHPYQLLVRLQAAVDRCGSGGGGGVSSLGCMHDALFSMRTPFEMMSYQVEQQTSDQESSDTPAAPEASAVNKWVVKGPVGHKDAPVTLVVMEGDGEARLKTAQKLYAYIQKQTWYTDAQNNDDQAKIIHRVLNLIADKVDDAGRLDASIESGKLEEGDDDGNPERRGPLFPGAVPVIQAFKLETRGAIGTD